jgi:CoA:oxalate CoA-transferase
VYRDLAREADVVVENFRVGKTEEWGIGYEDLREENSGLVYCSLTGYGEWGPDRDRPAYDLVVQAEAGMMSITGEANGRPVRVGVAVADLATGLYASQSILSALLGRELGDGTGQKVDVSLFDAAVALNSYMTSVYFATGDPPGRMGSRHPTIVPYQAFPTQDGYVVIAVPSQNLWPAFCGAIDRGDLVDDPRFATNPDRVENRETLEPLLEEEIATYGTDEIVKVMRDCRVPATPINEMDDVFEHPQVLARNMRASIEHPSGTTVEMAGVPMHFSETGTGVRRHPPGVGEHTDEILAEIGRSSDEIERLHEEGIV